MSYMRRRSSMEASLDPAPQSVSAGGSFDVETVSVRIGDTVLEIGPKKGVVEVTVHHARRGRKWQGEVTVDPPDVSGAVVIRVPV